MIQVALVYGGNSTEWEISVLSGKNVASHLDATKYRVFEILLRDTSWQLVAVDGVDCSHQGIQIDKNNFTATWEGQKMFFDVALIMIHGTPGENGMFTSYLEMLHVPHTGCPAPVALVTFEKFACKCFLRQAGILMPREYRLMRSQYKHMSQEALVAGITAAAGPLPWFVKPNAAGSSFGVTKVKTVSELQTALEEAFTEGDVVLIEEFIQGRELTNGIMGDIRLPVTEIIPHRDCEFFDYKAKYNGASSEVTPAAISPELTSRIQEESAHIYDYLGCKGVVRMDYIVRDDAIYFLEVNTIPGMTQMSLVPQQIRAAGRSVSEFMDTLITRALKR